MRLVLHLVPRSGAGSRASETLGEEVGRLRVGLASDLSVRTLSRVPNDPFGRGTRFESTLDIRGERFDAAAVFEHLDGLSTRLGAAFHADLSTALVGEDRVFIDGGETPVRYQYLMRRNASFTHEQYIERYVEIHSQFGLKTPGIEGYVQFHVDPLLSKEASQRSGVGVWEVDSISELHLVSLETFLGEVAKSPVGREAVEDEEKFVDRANSLDFCSALDAA